jgi:hypothetical protein
MLRSNSAVDNDLVAAHAMHALALKRVLSVELRYVRPACIVPRDAMAFFTAAALHDVRVYPAGSTSGLAEPAIIDDGSVVARTLITALADRVRRDAPAAPPPAPARTVAKIPDPPPRRPPHPLEPLAASLEDRLRELRVLAAVRIAGRDEPILRYTAGCLELAGDNARLAAVANACSAGSPWAAACVDALAAHALTVLDVALTQMTEAAQLHAIGALLLES